MSRVAKKPIIIPAGIEFSINSTTVEIKGPKGVVRKTLGKEVAINRSGDVVTFAPKENVEGANAIAGTARAIVNNMLVGATKGFVRKLLLVGVGFKAQVQGKVLNLSLGFSHPVNYVFPEEVTIEVPNQNEVIVKGADKHVVGQVAAEIRAFRAPEPYKGKGIRYEGEVIAMKEGKKK